MSALVQWLGELPQWFQMVVISATMVALGLLLRALVIKGFKFKTRVGEVDVGPDVTADRPKTYSPPAIPFPPDMVHVKDVIMVLNQSMKVLTRKMEIKNFLTMRQQMNFAEERIDHALLFMQSIYIDLLKKKGMFHVTTCDSFNIYRLILNTMKVRMLHEFRSSFHDDSFAEITDDDFRVFAETKVDTMHALVTSTLNELYFFNQDITRDELYDANYQELTKLRGFAREVYYYARKVAQEYEQEIQELDAGLEKLFASVAG